MATPSPCPTPVVWARLIRVDPPKPSDDAMKEIPISPTESSNVAHKEGKILHHTIKSHDFPDGDVFSINSDTFKIGRANSCHLSIRYNKLVSGAHCLIHRDNDGNVWIEDTSTNGTLVNRTAKVLRDKIPLKNGDTIHLVFKNKALNDNVGFKFELIQDDISETFGGIDQTLCEEIEVPVENSGTKRSPSPFDDSPVPKKKIHVEGGTGAVNASATKKGDNDDEEDDEIGDTLLCIICQDIFHDCVSLQPCMHSFCSGCYSEWMATSNECPCCRLKVERINKNHLVNNLVDGYLKKNPLKKRSDTDLKALDAKNKITHDMLYKRRTPSHSGSGSSSPASSDGSPSATPPLPAFINYNPLIGRVMPTFGPPRTVCRQCPNYVQGNNTPCAAACGTATTTAATPSTCGASVADTATATGAAATGTSGDATTSATAADAPGCSTATDAATANPATRDIKSNPQAPDFVCVPGQNHMLCMCCLQPMPDRRNHRLRDPTIPQQQCSICHRFYCHAYWTCPKADCLGCLGKFRDMNFGRKCLNSILLENQFESGILRDYLDSKGLSVRQLLDACIRKMEAGEYGSTDYNRGALNGDTFVCYPCGFRNFQELAYQYRKDIDVADLPAAVTRREDCYWGRGCRTQKHKPHHAAKLNHICDATRNVP